MGLSDAPGQLRLAAEEAAQAWADDSRLSSRGTMPWDEESTGAVLVDMYLAELAAHAWDLARATAQLDWLDRSLAVPALNGARAMIKPEYATRWRIGGCRRPRAPDWERFVAFTGRDPRAPVARQRGEQVRPACLRPRPFERQTCRVVDCRTARKSLHP